MSKKNEVGGVLFEYHSLSSVHGEPKMLGRLSESVSSEKCVEDGGYPLKEDLCDLCKLEPHKHFQQA